MRNSSLLLFLILIINSGCENLFINENNNQPVTAIVQHDTFIIKNNLTFDIYFFAVDREVSFVIDWIQVESEENRIPAGSFRKFSTDAIVGYKPGKMAISYVWGANNYFDTMEIKEYPDL